MRTYCVLLTLMGLMLATSLAPRSATAEVSTPAGGARTLKMTNTVDGAADAHLYRFAAGARKILNGRDLLCDARCQEEAVKKAAEAASKAPKPPPPPPAATCSTCAAAEEAAKRAAEKAYKSGRKH